MCYCINEYFLERRQSPSLFIVCKTKYIFLYKKYLYCVNGLKFQLPTRPHTEKASYCDAVALCTDTHSTFKGNRNNNNKEMDPSHQHHIFTKVVIFMATIYSFQSEQSQRNKFKHSQHFNQPFRYQHEITIFCVRLEPEGALVEIIPM